MADANSQAKALARELSTANFDADDLPNLARNIYVRCLLKVRAAGGASNSAKALALTVTGDVLKQIVGMHFTAADVQQLLDEEAGVTSPEEPGKPKPPPLDPYDLGM